MYMTEQIMQLQKMIDDSSYTVFFGGAGVSTESGIPDFRSSSGLSAKKYKYPFEEILSHQFFFDKTNEFYDYYFSEMVHLDAKPNAAHKKLAELEQSGKLKAVITQNIDGLHQAAGSINVYELHGSVHRNYCTKCGRAFGGIDKMIKSGPVPHCECGGVIKPDVVLYGEPLDDACIVGAVSELEKADLVIVGGTSLAVYPAAGLLGYTAGKIIVINRDKINGQHSVSLQINALIGETLAYIN